VDKMESISFENIFSSYEKPLYNYVLRMVKDTQTAEDLTQDIFIKIYQKTKNGIMVSMKKF
jgi:DNA-directed RNA polymerase specialized sigma24 family protein